MDHPTTWALLAALALLLLTAAAWDLRIREIPDTLVAAIALLAIPFWWMTDLALWPDVAWRFGVALLIFALFAFAFTRGWMGGGDVKLLTALVLWLPPAAVLVLIVIMSLAGGLLTLAMVLWHRMRRIQATVEIPYGVAIAFAGLWLISERFLNQFG